MTRPTRTPRELRHWDYKKNGPVPQEYWEQRAAHAEVMEGHHREMDRLLIWIVLAVVIGLPLLTLAAQLLGYGPIR